MFQFRTKKYRQLNDNELIEEFKQSKKQDLFGEIYERYGHLVMGVCLKYIKDEAESQDMCSKIFEELSEKISKHTIINFKSWLYQVVKNECMQFHRKNKYIFVSSELLQNEEIILDINESKEQKLILLEDALLSLSKEQIKCIKLFYLENKSYLEISIFLKIEIKNVKSYIQNGKRKLYNILSQNQEFSK